MSLSSHETHHLTPDEDPKLWGPFANGSEDDGQDHASTVEPEL